MQITKFESGFCFFWSSDWLGLWVGDSSDLGPCSSGSVLPSDGSLCPLKSTEKRDADFRPAEYDWTDIYLSHAWITHLSNQFFNTLFEIKRPEITQYLCHRVHHQMIMGVHWRDVKRLCTLISCWEGSSARFVGKCTNSFCMFIREHFVVTLLRYFHQFKDINSSDLQVLFISNWVWQNLPQKSAAKDVCCTTATSSGVLCCPSICCVPKLKVSLN